MSNICERAAHRLRRRSRQRRFADLELRHGDRIRVFFGLYVPHVESRIKDFHVDNFGRRFVILRNDMHLRVDGPVYLLPTIHWRKV